MPLSALLGTLIGGLLSLIFGFWCAVFLPVSPAEYGFTFWQYVAGFLFCLILGSSFGIVAGFALRVIKRRTQVWSRFRRITKQHPRKGVWLSPMQIDADKIERKM